MGGVCFSEAFQAGIIFSEKMWSCDNKSAFPRQDLMKTT